ncbi:TPA: hypothetical protein HA274_03220 [Candidatus Bathyarchaeota archaeon]|nr:hypothetical protein [Candidatus Bathyarchaeota archaeon]
MAGNSTLLKIVAIVAVAAVSTVAFFAAMTFPRTIVNLPVSFTVGFEREQRAFEVPWLHDTAQIAVAVSNGTSLWRASITDSNGEEVWSHSALQGEATTFISEWVKLPNSGYNFTFSTIGAGSLNASIKLTSKGGFW